MAGLWSCSSTSCSAVFNAVPRLRGCPRVTSRGESQSGRAIPNSAEGLRLCGVSAHIQCLGLRIGCLVCGDGVSGQLPVEALVGFWWDACGFKSVGGCRPMRISAGSDSLAAEFLRGRGGGKQARIVSWQLTNSRSGLQHCLNPPAWRRRLSASDYTWKHGLLTHVIAGMPEPPRTDLSETTCRVTFVHAHVWSKKNLDGTGAYYYLLVLGS